ncbi:unnamed protein product [Durusdinium trenchii]|uniref:Uncharacterized protein n=1 Tax=Durusdinium trenchii TaxID=1381693 RepID=A0ABP0NZQ6_9DINO
MFVKPQWPRLEEEQIMIRSSSPGQAEAHLVLMKILAEWNFDPPWPSWRSWELISTFVLDLSLQLTLRLWCTWRQGAISCRPASPGRKLRQVELSIWEHPHCLEGSHRFQPWNW